MGLRRWLWDKIGMPAHLAGRDRQDLAWDYSQANDWAVCDGDPDKDRVFEAAAFLDHDPNGAFYRLLTYAQGGSAWAMLNVGWCCEVGRGVPANATDAEYWYRLAFDAGCDRALIEYGRILGRRGERALQQEVYDAGAARDWAPAIYRSAESRIWRATTLEERRACLPLFKRAAELGSARARRLLCRHMAQGRFGWRYRPAGFRLAWAILLERFAEIDRESARSMGEPGTANANQPLH